MSVVLDSSVTLAWVHGDERTTQIETLLDRVVEEGAVVPGHWHLEIANALTMAVRRQRVTAAFRDEVLLDLAELPLEVDEETPRQAWHASKMLADAYALTLYDAAYLELAQRRRLPLATLDQALAEAARASGVEIRP